MKIGIDGRFWHSTHGGLSQYTKGIIKALAQHDKENEYIVFLKKLDLEEWDIEAANFRTAVVNVNHFSLREQLILPWKLLSFNLDLMFFPNFNHPIFYPGKFITTIHDLAYFYFPADKLKGKIYKLGYFLTIWLGTRRSNKILVDTDIGKSELVLKLKADPAKIHVVNLGVDSSRFVQDKKQIVSFKKKLGIKYPVIFYLGGWKSHKNILNLLLAFEKIRQKKIPAHLLLGGKPTGEIKDAVASHPFKEDIIITGFISESEIACHFGLADVFVFPSVYEGFGLPILEAQSMNIPVTASKISTLPEVGGEGALYFDPSDIDDIAGSIIRILEDQKLREKLIKKGKDNLNRYSWEKASVQIHSIFDEGLKRCG